MQVLYNGHIYTQDGNNPYVTAIAVENDQIKAIGSDAEILSLSVSNKQEINLFGKTIWPGLTDAHIHLENYAFSLQWVDCETDTREQCLVRVEKQARQSPGGAWVIGHGWNQNSWSEGFGDISQVDPISFGHPIYLTAKSLHAAWVNSLALQQAGINALTPDPPGGKIVRDSKGYPTGILLEAAMGQVEKAIPVPTQVDICHSLLVAQTKLIQMGITSLHDYDPRSCFSALQELHQ
jgi:predicted amidohydrolase YtcJ